MVKSATRIRNVLPWASISLKDIPRRKLRNTFTVLAIIIGVALVIGVNVTLDSVIHQFEDTARKATGNVDIIVTSLEDTPFDEDVLTIVREVEHVSTAAGRVRNTGVVFQEDLDVKVVTLIGVNSSSDFEYFELNVTRNVSSTTQHVVLDVNSTQAVVDESLHYNVGDNFTLHVVTWSDQTDPLNQSKPISFTVVGVNHPQGGFRGHTIYIDLVTAQRICNCSGQINSLLVKVSNVGLTDTVVNELNSRLDLKYIVNPIKQNVLSDIEETSLGLASGFQVSSTVGLCVSIVIVLNTMYMNVGERIREIGILRSIGASTKQIFWLFFSESLILGVAGAAIGIPTGVFINSVFKYLVDRLFFIPQAFTLDFSISQLKYWILGAGAGVITAVLGGIFPSLAASKIDVIQALRPTMRKTGNPRTAFKLIVIGLPLTFFGIFEFVGFTFFREVSWGVFAGFLLASIPVLGIIFLTAGFLRIANPIIERLLFLFKGNSKIISRNIDRNLVRSTACFALIGLSLSFVVVMGSTQTGVTTGIEEVIKSFASSDLTVISQTSISKSFDTNLTNVGDGTLISRVTPIFIIPQSTLLINNLSLIKTLATVVTIDPNTYSQVMSMQFSIDTPTDVFTTLDTPGTIILTAPLALTLNVSIGDILTVSTYANNTTTWTNFTVVGIAEGFWLELMSFSGITLSKACYLSYPSLNLYFPTYKDEATVFFVEASPNQDVDQIKNEIMESYENGHKLTIITQNDILNEVNNEVNKIFLTLYTIVLFAIVNAVIGMTSILIMNVTMRRREIGVLRSQGMSSFQVTTSIIGEGFTLGLVGFITGIALGFIFHSITVNYMNFGGFKIDFIISPPSITLALVLAALISIISAAFPAYRTSKLNIAESLRR